MSGNKPAGMAAWLQLVAAALIQCRLLCNLFDGMVAVEGGFKTKSGEIFNELPDRFADVLIIAAAGYAYPQHAWSPVAGWLAAVLAVITAYVRALGVACGTSQHFKGPMAKPQRMALMTFACLVNATLIWFNRPNRIVFYALVVMILGGVVTIVRRSVGIIREMESA
jgi:phosphatidylglycerophosphate synthase